jgi:hypothetical protein
MPCGRGWAAGIKITIKIKTSRAGVLLEIDTRPKRQ